MRTRPYPQAWPRRLPLGAGLAVVVLVLLLAACSTAYAGATGEDSFRVNVESQSQQTTTIKFFCRGAWLGSLSNVETNQELSARVPLRGCETFYFVLSFIAIPKSYSVDPITVSAGDCWDITIGAKPQYTRWAPCPAA